MGELERGFYQKITDIYATSIDYNATAQLAINGENDALWKKFKSLGMGAHIQVNGALFHRFTGHHHAKILLEVKAWSRSQRMVHFRNK